MAYVALAELKSQLGVSGTTTHDNVLERLLLASQAAIDTLTNETWESPASREEFFVVDSWTSTLDIPPAQSVSAVAEKEADGSWADLTEGTDWDELETSEATERLIRRGCWKPSRYGEASVRVTGVFAKTATAPNDIKEATLILAARLFQRKDVPLGFTAAGVEAAAMRLAKTDPDVATLIQGKRRHGVG